MAHGLDFGSGFRRLLHKFRDGKGAWLTIRAGLVRLGQKDKSCSAAWMASMSLGEVQQFFDLQVQDLLPLAEFLREDINEMGSQLLAHGYKTPGEFLEDIIADGATQMVYKLVEYFPLTFKDEYCVNNQQVCFYKKAQLVVSEVYMRFYREDERFKFKDIDNLTAFVDNVVVAMMRQNNIIVVNDKNLTEKLESEEVLLKGSEEEVCLRARALTAVEIIVDRINEREKLESGIDTAHLNAQRLCNWLWGGLGKMPENRQYSRHLVPSTSFY